MSVISCLSRALRLLFCILLEVLLANHWLLLTYFCCLSLRAWRRLIETCPSSLWLAHIEWDRLTTWLIRLEVVVIDIIVVDDVCHILGWLGIAPLTHWLDLTARRKRYLVKISRQQRVLLRLWSRRRWRMGCVRSQMLRVR